MKETENQAEVKITVKKPLKTKEYTVTKVTKKRKTDMPKTYLSANYLSVPLKQMGDDFNIPSQEIGEGVKTTAASNKKILKVNEKTKEEQKYSIKCGVSGEVLEKPRYTYVSNQRNGTSEYVHENHLDKLNTCSSCKKLFVEKLEENHCYYCINRAVERHILPYHTKAESKLSFIFSPTDPTKVKFCDKNISTFYAGKNPSSFIYSCGNSEPQPNLFGIELEYECKKSRGLAVLKVHPLIKEFAVLKRDSTLVEGFEIVSAPADKLAHYKIWDSLFTEIEKDNNIECTPYSYDEAKGKGVGCGLHIHISKDSMIHHNAYSVADKNGAEKDLRIVTGLPIAKLQTFIYSKYNRKFVELMAGRKSNMYNDFTAEKGIMFDVNGKITAGARSVINLENGGFDHRTAVNFNTSNGKTIEFRIFRSTKNKLELLKNIDFVDAICCFCRTGNASLQEMKDWIYFYEFVSKNRQDYPFLFKFFETDKDFLLLLSNKENGIEGKSEISEQPIISNVIPPEPPLAVAGHLNLRRLYLNRDLTKVFEAENEDEDEDEDLSEEEELNF